MDPARTDRPADAEAPRHLCSVKASQSDGASFGQDRDMRRKWSLYDNRRRFAQGLEKMRVLRRCRNRVSIQRRPWGPYGERFLVYSSTSPFRLERRSQQRSTVPKLKWCTRSWLRNSRLWSIEQTQSYCMTTRVRTFQKLSRKWMNWDAKLCHIQHIYRIFRSPCTTFSSIWTTC